MKKQVVAIHGGDYRKPAKKFMAELKKEKVEAGDFKRSKPRWKDTLQETLGSGFEVFNPRMPLSDNAYYPEWKAWFDKLVPFLHDEVIFVGQSLGAMFLAKYLSENKLPVRIKAVYLIAGLFETSRRGSAGFRLRKNLSLIETQSDKVILCHSKDDTVVPFSNLAKFKEALPYAEVRVYDGKGHFIIEKFPEIVKDIKNLS